MKFNKMRDIKFNIKASLLFFAAAIWAVSLISAHCQAKSATAYDFSLKDLNGNTVSLSDLLKLKQKVLIFFWATWCPHCQSALKSLSKKTGNYKLITVNIGESKDIINRFIRRNSYNFVVLMDDEATVSSEYGVLGIPTFILIEPDSTISYKDYTFPPDLK